MVNAFDRANAFTILQRIGTKQGDLIVDRLLTLPRGRRHPGSHVTRTINWPAVEWGCWTLGPAD